jgi:uncharacterized Fe-S center protein
VVPGQTRSFSPITRCFYLGTDPVAVDTAGYDIIIGKRIEMGRQAGFADVGLRQMLLAEELGLGIADRERIDLRTAGR